MNAEVKSGYKLTELGVVPKEWKCCSVEQLVSDGILQKPMDGNHGNIHPKSSDFVSDGIPFVMANNIKDGSVDLRNCSFIRKSQADNLQKGFSKPGDVLLTHKATIGQVAIVGCIKTEYIMLTPQVTYYRVANKSLLDNFYLRHFFESDVFQRVLQSMSGGGTRSYIGITAQRLLPVLLPPLAEQVTIAGCLSDIDALINCLNQLIVKKRNIKQAAMQQLITGQQRLPGFSGEWEVKRLGEVFSISSGQSKSAHIATYGNYWIVDMGSVSTDGKLIVSKITDFKGDFLKVGDLVMPKDDIGGGGIIGRVGYIDADETYVLSDHVYRMRANFGDPLFLSYAINGYSINSALRKKVIGSAQLGLSRKSVEEQEISLPSLEEQTTIATILSDMDSELTGLEIRRDKARQIKQGMMQELLTGKIRIS